MDAVAKDAEILDSQAWFLELAHCPRTSHWVRPDCDALTTTGTISDLASNWGEWFEHQRLSTSQPLMGVTLLIRWWVKVRLTWCCQ